MKLLDVLTAPWSIVPEKMQEIRSIYQTHMRGDKVDLKAIAVVVPQPKTYEIRDGIAIISVEGVLTKGRSFFSYLFGGSSMREIGDAFETALEDPAVGAIVLAIDSPGGTVDGTQELVRRISGGRGKKPVVAWADGMVASGAYWAAAAADKIYISGDTVQAGSIGVVATHIDVTEQDRQYGEKWTEITAGQYKRIASSHAPLSPEGRAYLQGQVDHLYTVFVESVAQLRGQTVEQVLEGADGRIFIGRQAVDVGLVDGVATLSDVINQLSEEIAMNKEEIRAKYPEVAQSIFEEGRSAGIQDGIERGKKEGRDAAVAEVQTQERERIKAIYALSSPGNEKIIEEAMFDGSCSAGDAAQKILLAEKKRREDMAEAIRSGAVPPVPAAEEPPPAEEPKETFEQAVDRLVKDGTSRGKAMAAVAREFPALHQDYLRRVNAK